MLRLRGEQEKRRNCNQLKMAGFSATAVQQARERRARVALK
jgi:hypothetical protein